jgi:nitrite reductase/ring-hydroxylating ferredoxin subunit
MQLKKRIALFLMLVFSPFLFLNNSCHKDKNEDQVPYAVVDFYINVNSTQYLELHSVNGWVNVTGGVRGIIIYRKSVDEFMAYERNCTYQPSNSCARVSVDNSNVMAVDSCCGSKFLLVDGSVVQSPAIIPLKQYRTTFDGATLHVYN